MLYLCDQHTHSYLSMDSDTSLDELCTAAIDAGLSEICVTDHCDINNVLAGIYGYDADEARRAVAEAKEKYADRLRLTYAVEIGQGTQCQKEADALLDSYPYEFVLGSLHNLRGVPDFYFISFAKMEEKEYALLFERYMAELRELIAWGRFHSLAHMTYPLRYIMLSGRRLDITPYREQMDEIFRMLIDRGIAMEFNTSGLYKGLGETIPSMEVAKWYREAGGEFITVGSDAHVKEHVGDGIREAYEMLAQVGFRYVTTFHGSEVDGRPLR